MKRINVQYNRATVLADAEAGARWAHEGLRHVTAEWADLSGKEIGLRLDDRIQRALKYAEWRIKAYEAGECDTPW